MNFKQLRISYNISDGLILFQKVRVKVTGTLFQQILEVTQIPWSVYASIKIFKHIYFMECFKQL